MAIRLEWDAPGERLYTYGLDRGVLYVGENPGVPWNGLVRVTRDTASVEVRSSYIDGVKYQNDAGPEEYGATLEAFYSPAEFDECDGTTQLREGFFAGSQPRKEFSLSYRTLIGSDASNREYKLHFVYNALAVPTAISHETLNSSPAPNTLAWNLTTRPVIFEGGAPSAYFSIETTGLPEWFLTELEEIMYGTDEQAPRMPTVAEIMAISDYSTGV